MTNMNTGDGARSDVMHSVKRPTLGKCVALGLFISIGSLAGPHKVSARTVELHAGTYVGGPGNEVGRSLSLAADGSIYIAGHVMSPGLPNALNSLSGSMDIFVIKLSADFSTVLWSRYVGGTGQFADLEFASDCAATPDGGVVVTGKTEVADFPTVNALDNTLNGPSDAVLFKLDTHGAIVFSTYIGGSGGENADGAGLGKFMGEVEVAADGSIFLAGNTRSADFPLVNPIDDTFGGFQDDVFVMKISADGQTILASTYLGDEFRDEVWGMRLDSSGRPVLVGNGGPGWLYTPGAFSFGTPSSSGIVYATKLSADAQSIVWSARIDRVDNSGGHLDFNEVAIGPDDRVTVVGRATGNGFPIPRSAWQPNITSGSPTRDAIALTFSADGSQITSGTFIGVANIGEVSWAVDVDSHGQPLIAVNFDTSPPNPARLYKFDPSMQTLIESPVLLANPGQTQQLQLDDQNNPVILIAGSGPTTPGAFLESDPGGTTPYVARWNMNDLPTNLGDINGDGIVNVSDLLAVISAWGDCLVPSNCAADVTGDGVVNVSDLLVVISNWS